MQSILRKNNIYNDLYEIFSKSDIKVDISALSEYIFEYAKMCRREPQKFNEKETYNEITSRVPDTEMATRVWATMMMYTFEKLCYKLMGKYGVADSEDHLTMCLATIVRCATLFDHNASTSFSTYLYTSIENNIRNEKREDSLCRLPHSSARETAIISELISNNPNVTVEDVVKATGLPEKKARMLLYAVQSHLVVSLDTGASQDDEKASFDISSGEDVQQEYIRNEEDTVVKEEFLPVVADIFGNDVAFITRMRAGTVWGEEKRKFEDMEDDFCRYLSFSHNLKIFAERSPEHKVLCEKVDLIYATAGRNRMLEYLETCKATERILIQKVMEISSRDADKAMKERVNSPYFRQTDMIRYSFSRAFPNKGFKVSGMDRMRLREFKHALRIKGLDRVADAMNERTARIPVACTKRSQL